MFDFVRRAVTAVSRPIAHLVVVGITWVPGYSYAEWVLSQTGYVGIPIPGQAAMSAAVVPPQAPASQPPASSLVYLHIGSLSAALTKLGITVPAQVIIDAVKEEEQKRPATLSASVDKRHPALVNLAHQIPQSGPSSISYTPMFFEHYPLSNLDPKSKERKKRLIAMTNEAFPPGKPWPDPYTSVWLTTTPDDEASRLLPFVIATCIIKPLHDTLATVRSSNLRTAVRTWTGP